MAEATRAWAGRGAEPRRDARLAAMHAPSDRSRRRLGGNDTRYRSRYRRVSRTRPHPQLLRRTLRREEYGQRDFERVTGVIQSSRSSDQTEGDEAQRLGVGLTRQSVPQLSVRGFDSGAHLPVGAVAE